MRTRIENLTISIKLFSSLNKKMTIILTNLVRFIILTPISNSIKKTRISMREVTQKAISNKTRI